MKYINNYMIKIINWLIYSRNGQSLLIIIIALYLAALLQNW